MSNVLIGIIGVILFIGLALAGALILGDDFRSASNATKAATYVGEMSQIAQAVNMYELKVGQRIADNASLSVLKPRFLSSGFDVTKPYVIRRSFEGNGSVNYVYRFLPLTDEAVCAEVQQTAGTGRADGAMNKAVQWSSLGPPDAGSVQVNCVPYDATRLIVYKMI